MSYGSLFKVCMSSVVSVVFGVWIFIVLMVL
jgi:hypothetical protein